MKKLKCSRLFIFVLMTITLSAIFSFTASADSTTKSSAYLKFAYNTGDTVAYDICFHDTEGLNITQFGMTLDYSDNLTLVSCTKVYEHGAFATSGIDPLTFIWAVGNNPLPKGETTVARAVFGLEKELSEGESISFTISFYEAEPPKDNNGTILTDKIEIIPYFEYTASDFTCNTDVGDVNSDGKITIGDASLMLMYIAKWDNLQIDLQQADVYFDGKVNIFDVSMLLKFVAKWNSVRPGHDDVMKITQPSTCQLTGKATLTCKRCGNIEEIDVSVIPCKYVSSVEKAPTCGKEGIERHSCEMCGDSYTTPIKKTTNHSYKSTVISKPTCTDRGESKYTCTICGDTQTVYMNATGKHEYKNGWCIYCDKVDFNDSTVDKLKRYANWLKNNGVYEEGGYTYSVLYDDTYLVSNTYYPANDSIVVSCMYEYDGIIYIGAAEFNICSGSEWWNGWFEASYAAIGTDGIVYIAGSEGISPPGFCNGSFISFEYFYSDVYDSYTRANEEHAYSVIKFTLQCSSEIFEASDTGLKLKALEFNF